MPLLVQTESELFDQCVFSEYDKAVAFSQGKSTIRMKYRFARLAQIDTYEDQVVLSAISHILSSGKSSRFEKKLVHEKRLVNQIYGYNMEMKDPGVFLIMGLCSEGVTPETVEKEILSELEKLKNGDVTQAELDKVKINTKAEFIYSLESSHSVTSLYGDYLVKGNLKPLLEYEEKLDKITLKDISDVAKKYFDHDLSTTVILKKHEEKQIKK
jgi:predicted Zn-dependent peptidase